MFLIEILANLPFASLAGKFGTAEEIDRQVFASLQDTKGYQAQAQWSIGRGIYTQKPYYKGEINLDPDLLKSRAEDYTQSLNGSIVKIFNALGDLILSFSKQLDQEASFKPSGQHALNEEYYERIEAIQFTMNHDDGNLSNDINKSDIILLGVSRTSKTPTSIYLANKGFKVSNIPLVNENSIPNSLKNNKNKICIIGLTAEPNRLVEVRKNRMSSLKDNTSTNYVNFEKISQEVEEAKKTFQKYKWPVIDVSRKSVEETAASVIKIFEISKKNV